MAKDGLKVKVKYEFMHMSKPITAKSFLEQQGEFQPFIQGLSQGQKELITSIMNGYCKEHTAQLIKRYRDWKEETQYFKDLLEEIGVFIDWDRQV